LRGRVAAAPDGRRPDHSWDKRFKRSSWSQWRAIRCLPTTVSATFVA
jgi:hypothetical protein